MGDVACNRRQEGQTKMQSETEPFLFPEAGAASGSLSAEERLDWRQFGWGGIGGDSWKHSRRGRGEEAGERTLEEDEPQEVTLKDIHDLLSESTYLSWQESHGDSGMTANLPETNDADEEEQGSDDENDLSVLVVLGDRWKHFNVTSQQRTKKLKVQKRFPHSWEKEERSDASC